MLRTHKLGEADRIITLLGREYGKIRAVAKGVRKPTSKFGGRLEPFMVVNAQFRHGRSLDIVAGAETLRAYSDPISRDYNRYTAGNTIVETADILTNADRGNDHYTLLLGALGSLARGDHTPELVRGSYILRALTIAGWQPIFDRCVRCGRTEPISHVAIALGGAVCDDCAVPGTPKVEAETLALLQALLLGDWSVADTSTSFARAESASIIAAYLQFVLERRISSITVGNQA